MVKSWKIRRFCLSLFYFEIPKQLLSLLFWLIAEVFVILQHEKEKYPII